jgi:transcriptional regulator with XRE-family HTH domain
MRQLTKEQFLAQLQDRVNNEGSQRKLARKLKISPGYLNDVLQRRKEPREKLLKSLGLRAVTNYVKASGTAEEKEEENKP